LTSSLPRAWLSEATVAATVAEVTCPAAAAAAALGKSDGGPKIDLLRPLSGWPFMESKPPSPAASVGVLAMLAVELFSAEVAVFLQFHVILRFN